jgi:hypothetical protein
MTQRAPILFNSAVFFLTIYWFYVLYLLLSTLSSTYPLCHAFSYFSITSVWLLLCVAPIFLTCRLLYFIAFKEYKIGSSTLLAGYLLYREF